MEGLDRVEVPQHVVEGVNFRFYSSEDIRQLSVKQITNSNTFDSLKQPCYGGLYDPALGPTDQDDACGTCGQGIVHCPGHMGHIELPLTTLNPVYFSTLYQILKSSCMECHRMLITPTFANLFIHQTRLLLNGFLHAVEEVSDLVSHLTAEHSGSKNTLEEIINAALTEFTEEKLKGKDEPEVSQKHTQAVRNELVTRVIREHMPRPPKCIHCSARIPPIRQENSAKIVLLGKLRAIPETPSKKRRQTLKKQILEEDEEEEEEDGEDKENVKESAEVLMDELRKSVNGQKRGGTKQSEVTLLTPVLIREHLRAVWKADGPFLSSLYTSLACCNSPCPVDIFFLDVIPVPPSRFRPASVMKGEKYNNPQTDNLVRVLVDCSTIRQILELIKDGDKTAELKNKTLPSAVATTHGSTLIDKLNTAWMAMQAHVNCIVDSGLDTSDDAKPGIKQLLEKKEGLFRKFMMGKRVNYAARSVISPDPNLNSNEIGIPEVFAKTLTYPQPVTPWNVQELRQAVINGPNKHPGACSVVNEDGFKVKLKPDDRIQRETVAKQLLKPSTPNKPALFPKKVYRHLKNGDILLLNRQPTLHRPSIQAHRARVLPREKTLRLHYANCKAYNADFDGDEMNAHFPQNEVARAEAYNIASTDFQYLVPKDGTPLAGLIQDHMVSGVSLTLRGRFFSRDDYCKLVYTALVDKNGPIKLLPPAMIKPYRLWSGKQVLSTVVLNVIPGNKPPLSLTGKSKVPEKSWGKCKVKPGPYSLTPQYMGESDVVIRQGELLVGVLDKGHYGPTPFGLIHSCYELYGGVVAGKMLTCFGRLFLNFLQIMGFTLGVRDILVTDKADRKRARIIRKSPGVGKEAAKLTLDPDEKMDDAMLIHELRDAHFCLDDRRMRELDLNMRNKTNKIQDDIVTTCMPTGLQQLFPDNNLQLMVQSGAKGSSVNCMQISCLLGQIELEGKRPPLMLSGRSLPSFRPYDLTPRAGGFVTGRFLTGIRQQEYFFHCMAGREGLIDTAVKTSRSGYLQRCLIKHMEGLRVNYDLTVRDSDASIIQFYYGEDGLDISKVSYLSPKQFPFLLENRVSDTKQTRITEDEEVGQLKKDIKKWQKKHGPVSNGKKRQSGFLAYSQSIQPEDVPELPAGSRLLPGRSEEACRMCRAWRQLSDKKRDRWERKHGRCPDPVMIKYTPYIGGVIPEKQSSIITGFSKSDLSSLAPGVTEEQFQNLMNFRLRRAVTEPGEPVGLLCAQSIGEPSTQMTLNTFHFAGRGEMNVTLGIPRLREILMVGSREIGTPAMDVPVVSGPEAKAKAKYLQKKFNKVYLNEVLKNVVVKEFLSVRTPVKSERHRAYHVRFNFLPPECYTERLVLTPRQILKFMETKYIKQLLSAIRKKMVALFKMRLVSAGTQRVPMKGTKKTNDDDDDDRDEDAEEIEENDVDAADEKFLKKKQDAQEYEIDEEGEKAEEDEVEMDEDDKHLSDNEQENDQIYEETEDKSSHEDMMKNQRVSATEESSRIKEVLVVGGSAISDYKFDTKNQLWCEVCLRYPILDSKIDMLAFIETHVTKAVVHEVEGISRCFLGDQMGPAGPELHLKTEGINLHELYKHRDILDLDRILCNNIHSVAEAYGIEAANRVIMKEIQAVFAAYGIEVDYRHLSLLADYMTCEGKYKPFNRFAMESNPSPFQKMSFETTMNFLVKASIHDGVDRLASPSSQIVMGKVVSTGTGSFDLLQPIC